MRRMNTAPDMEKFRSILKTKGLKATPQRLAVHEAMLAMGHASADMVRDWILSKGKEYFAVTDRRTIFVKKKNIKSVLHADIASLQLQDCGNCYVNGDYEKGFINLDARGTFQGALIALISMLAFEADPDRDRIRIN